MNKILNWFTRGRMVVMSLLGSIIFFISIFIDINIPVDVCYRGEFCGDVSEILTKFSLLFVSILFFSLIILFFKKSFVSWKKFTFIYLFIYLFIITIFPNYRDPLLPITEKLVALFLACVYLIISLILIIYQSLKKE